jgi:hypothetical protein
LAYYFFQNSEIPQLFNRCEIKVLECCFYSATFGEGVFFEHLGGQVPASLLDDRCDEFGADNF